MNPMAAVQSRINDIETRLGMSRQVGVGPSTGAGAMATTGTTAALGTGAGATGSVSGASFAAALGAAGAAHLPGRSGADVVSAATRYLGVPYRWGGTDPATGLDCSGFTQRVFADLGITIPRVVADQRNAGQPVPAMAQAQPGDLLVWLGSPNHIGIYVGDGKMIAAPKTGDVVKIQNVRDRPPDAIRRVVGDNGTAVAPPATSPVPFGSLFGAAEQRHSLPAGLLSAVARQESGFDADAVSPAGAVGLMQFMPGTALDLGINPRDPVQAIDGAGRYLRQQLDTFGSLPLALAAYNAGAGAVRAAGGIPPYAETTSYVTAILSSMPGGTR